MAFWSLSYAFWETSLAITQPFRNVVRAKEEHTKGRRRCPRTQQVHRYVTYCIHAEYSKVASVDVDTVPPVTTPRNCLKRIILSTIPYERVQPIRKNGKQLGHEVNYLR